MDYAEIKNYVDMYKLFDRLGFKVDKINRCACPIHGGDNKTAFSIHSDGQGWHCHTSCDCGGDIFGFMEKYEKISNAQSRTRIMEMFALSDSVPLVKKKSAPKSKTVVATKTFVYRKENGDEAFRVNRVDYDDGRKECFQECDGKKSLPESVRTLYNLDKIKQFSDSVIYLCEGEKTADALTAVGVISTTNPLGSKSWSEKYAKLLEGRGVVVMPDADIHGEEWRNTVLETLRGVAGAVQVVKIPDVFVKEHPEFTGHDFADYLKIYGDEKAFEDLMAWTDSAEIMPRGISANILGKPSDGFKEIQRKAKAGIRSDVFNLSRWIPSLDVIANRGDLIVLMANTSVGKTRLLHNMPYFIKNVNYAMFDLELSFEELCYVYDSINWKRQHKRQINVMKARHLI
jgi:DNA primase